MFEKKKSTSALQLDKTHVYQRHGYINISFCSKAKCLKRTSYSCGMQFNVLFTWIWTLPFLLEMSVKTTGCTLEIVLLLLMTFSLHIRYKYTSDFIFFNSLTDSEIVSKDFFERLIQAHLFMHLIAVTCFEVVVY